MGLGYGSVLRRMSEGTNARRNTHEYLLRLSSEVYLQHTCQGLSQVVASRSSHAPLVFYLVDSTSFGIVDFVVFCQQSITKDDPLPVFTMSENKLTGFYEQVNWKSPKETGVLEEEVHCT